MLYKFKSKTTGDLIMFEGSARRILEIIGKTADAKGIVLVEQMDSAIERLEAAVAKEKVDQLAASESGDKDEKDRPLSLGQRAMPFIDLLKRCRQDGSNLVWGV